MTHLSTSRIVGALALATLGAVLTQSPSLGADRDFVLKAGRIHTGTGAVIERGAVFVRDGKIAAVGQSVEAPPDVQVYDLPGHVVIPGLIDAETSLTGESSDVDKSVAPEILAVDGWDFFADRRILLRGGVTSVYVAPGISQMAGRPTRLVSGRGCVVKTAGRSSSPLSRVIQRAVGLQVTLGELPKRPPSIYDPPVAASPR